MAFLIVDILPLNTGQSVDDAVAYFEGLKPVFERHGLTRVDRPLEVVKTLRGSASANLINLFQTEDAEASMKGMGADPEYQSHIALRDQIFDLENATIHLVQSL